MVTTNRSNQRNEHNILKEPEDDASQLVDNTQNSQEDEIEIVFTNYEQISSEMRTKSEPTKVQTHGVVNADDIKIYLHQEAWEEMEYYFCKDLKREMGGVLLGGKYESETDGSHFIEIEHFIEGPSKERTGGSYKFTHATWEYINQQKDSKYPDLEIVGWAHTHPGMGVFMSNFDTFIHKNFFDLPLMVALVVEPRSGRRGFFRLKDGNIEECSGYYTVGIPEEPVITEPEVEMPEWAIALQQQVQTLQQRLRAPQERIEPLFRQRWKDVVLAGLAIVMLVLIADRFIIVRNFRQNFQGVKKNTESRITSVQDNMTAKIGELKKNAQTMEKRIATLESESKPESEPRVHIVKRGENLWEISARYLGDGRKYDKIAKENNIEKPYTIYPNQKIHIPSE